jgi:putative acetyltransferase
MRITEGDLHDPRVVAVVQAHLAKARETTPPESSHALDASGLQSPDIRFFTLWDGEDVAGIGALRTLTPEHGDIKSMFTVASMRGRGVGTTMLRHIIATAKKSGLLRLSLETGSSAYFEPARALYRSHGFQECPPYAHYRIDPNSVYMELDLSHVYDRPNFTPP